MKKRKVKLFASIASLGLVVAVMGVGVWAATQQAVKVSSQVSFVATSVAADITLQVHNNTKLTDYVANGKMDIVEKASLALTEKPSANPEDPAVPVVPTDPYEYNVAKKLTDQAGSLGVEQYVGRFVNDTAKTLYENRVYLKVADKDEDGYLNVGAQIVYEFIIKSHATSAPIYYEVYANLLNTTIPGTSYTLDQVFDITITDTTLTSFSATTNVETNRPNQAMITNWTAPEVPTTEDANAIQPTVGTGRTQATLPTGSTENLGYAYGEERRITVTYTVRDIDGASSSLYQGISYTMTSLQLGDIYIKIANSGKNLDGLPEFNEPIVDNSKVDKIVDWTKDKETEIEGAVLPDATPSQGGEDNNDDNNEENNEDNNGENNEDNNEDNNGDNNGEDNEEVDEN